MDSKRLTVGRVLSGINQKPGHGKKISSLYYIAYGMPLIIDHDALYYDTN
jgi:hypothetical protein